MIKDYLMIKIDEELCKLCNVVRTLYPRVQTPLFNKIKDKFTGTILSLSSHLSLLIECFVRAYFINNIWSHVDIRRISVYYLLKHFT